jgi:hypothetical protein
MVGEEERITLGEEMSEAGRVLVSDRDKWVPFFFLIMVVGLLMEMVLEAVEEVGEMSPVEEMAVEEEDSVEEPVEVEMMVEAEEEVEELVEVGGERERDKNSFSTKGEGGKLKRGGSMVGWRGLLTGARGTTNRVGADDERMIFFLVFSDSFEVLELDLMWMGVDCVVDCEEEEDEAIVVEEEELEAEALTGVAKLVLIVGFRFFFFSSVCFFCGPKRGSKSKNK